MAICMLTRPQTLNHEVFDDAMELRAFVSFSLWLLGEFLEVAGSLWHGSSEETNFNATFRYTSDFNVEEDLRTAKSKSRFKIKSEDVSFHSVFFLLFVIPMNQGERLEKSCFENGISLRQSDKLLRKQSVQVYKHGTNRFYTKTRVH